MNIRKILVSAVLTTMCLTVAAQSDNTPQKGDFTVAATVGYNSYTNVSALPGNLANYEAAATPNMWNDKKLMVGFEAGYFLTSKWKLNLGGGLNFSHNPGYGDRPGTIDESTGGDWLGEIPNYRAVASQYTCNYNVFAGVDRYLNTAVDNLKWYVGAQIGCSYALNEMKYDEWTSMGKSVGESVNLRGALTLGLDYYVLPGMFVGASIHPFAYTYSLLNYKPQEGLGTLQADCSSFSLFAAPTLKLGFKF